MAGFFLSNYIKILVQQEACDWTGKREVELRVVSQGATQKEKEARWRTNRMTQIPRGFI